MVQKELVNIPSTNILSQSHRQKIFIEDVNLSFFDIKDMDLNWIYSCDDWSKFSKATRMAPY